MNKKAKITIGLLVLLNLVLITFLYLGKPKHTNHKMPKDVIIEKLGFDESQQEEFKYLIIEHKKKAKNLQDEIAQNKTILYQEINNNKSSFNDSINRLIGDKFEELEKIHYNHFLGIKNICREDQKGKFQDLTEQLQTIFSPPNKRRRRNKKQ